MTIESDLTSWAEVGRELAIQRQEIEALKAALAVNQLNRASIEDSAVNAYDQDGNLRQRLGKQTDGRFAKQEFNGPPPAAPTAPTVEPDTLGLAVTWDGALTGPVPSDFSHVRVHISNASGVTGPVAATLSQSGMVAVSPLAVEPKFIVLVAVNTSGAASDPSAEVSATPNEVVATELVDGIVDELALADGAVTAAKIAVDAITEPKIDDDAVTSAKIAANAVDTTQITDDAVTTPKVVAGAIEAAQIAAGAVVAGKLAADSVESGNIAADAVEAGTIAANAVLAGTIAADAVQAGDITADAVTAREIAALTITADELAANSVIAGKILAGAVTADKIDATAITTEKIAAAAITAAQIAAGSITAEELSLGSGDSGNLHTDPSFEGFIDTTGDVGNWMHDGARVRLGSQSLRTTLTSDGQTNSHAILRDAAFGGSSLTISVWASAFEDGDVDVWFDVEYFDSGGALVDSALILAGRPTRAWQHLLVESVAPMNAATVTVGLVVPSRFAEATDIAFDNASILSNSTNILFDDMGMRIVSAANIGNGDTGSLRIEDPNSGPLEFDMNQIRHKNVDGTIGALFLQGTAGAVASAPSIRLTGSSRDLHGIDFGNTRIPTNSDGEIIVSHGLGVIPSAVLLTPEAIDPHVRLHVAPAGHTATEFTIVVVDDDGNRLGAGNDTSAQWIAFS